MGTGLSMRNINHLSLDNMLKSYCKEGRLTHRLDRKTSGLMVLAKSLDMAGWLTK
jgi:23S rRNA-/tRNA-specific pseudouridylate synthase